MVNTSTSSARVTVFDGAEIEGASHTVYTLENGGVAVTLAVVAQELPRIVYWGRALNRQH